MHQGLAVGELRLAPRSGEQLREADRRLIADLAPQVAAAVHAVGLAEAPDRAAALVELREEERRRIRRDLHDGLGPALAGLTFTLDAVHTSPPRPGRANALLASATEQTQAMIGDVRRLIYGLRPPALDELGLVESLRGIASRETSVPITVIVEAPEALPPLPAAVEVAAYRIVQEALTNVARHARARSCTVQISVQPDAVLLDIADDGQGIAQGPAGVGLQTMQSAPSSEELQDHRLPAPASTTVAVRLPRQAPRASWMSKSIRILIADDHPLFRGGLRALLESVSDTEVIGEATSGHEAVELTRTLTPDVVDGHQHARPERD